MVTSDNGLSHTCKGPGAVANGLTRITICASEVFLHFKLKLHTLGGVLSVPRDKNLTD